MVSPKLTKTWSYFCLRIPYKMSCCCILILVIIVIIFTAFICFRFIDKRDRVSGGHEVKFEDKTLHIENYKELKRVLREKHQEWKEEEAHAKARAEADRIVDEIVARMDKTLGYHQKAAFIDEEIMKVINSIRERVTE